MRFVHSEPAQMQINKNAADQNFELIISKDSLNYYVLNNYSYYLSLDKFKLNTALKLSYIAIRDNPTNPSYLDTYGWILFKMKKTKKDMGDGRYIVYYNWTE